ncbi:MAG: phosphatidate cytidylyltransferase, partial [Aquificaceae bacterium]|nr:phosphatidate cytidylyltransferase [Aquificaceae bacterium]
VVLLAFHGLVGFVWSMLLIPGAVMGDLFKSFIKRQVGVKDFSGVLGEHGGFTDRFDSLLFTAPVYVFLLKL